MNIYFARPTAAFHAYERSLLRPIDRPAPRDTPSLWQRAKSMFGSVIEKAAQLAQRFHIPRAERRDLLMRLKPVEKLARKLLIADAAVFLLMTPEGMKMRREVRIIAMPTRAGSVPKLPRAAGVVTGFRQIAVFDPHTLAVLKPAAPKPAHKPDPDDPKTWRCQFRVTHWVHPEPDEPPQKKPGPRPRLLSFDAIIAPAAKPRRKANTDSHRTGAIIARRIEALSRVIENPRRVMRRVARFFASLPRETLEPFGPSWTSMAGWHHGRRDYLAADAISDRAFTAFTRARIPDFAKPDFDGPLPEPG